MANRFSAKLFCGLSVLLLLNLSSAIADSNLTPSQLQSMQKIIQSPKQSIDSNYVEVSQKNFYDNILAIKKLVGPKVKTCIVMKADAYGYGLNNLIDAAIKAQPDCIAAIDNKEMAIIAGKIKKSGKNIHLIRIAPVTYDELVQAQVNNWHVEEIAGSIEEAQMLSQTAAELSKRLKHKVVIPIHINIETGMGRMGVREVADINTIMHMPNLKLAGLMTHFATADDDAPKDYNGVRAQTDKYESIVKQLNIPQGVIQHIANTGATSKFPWTHKDMVRVGSLAYGEDIVESATRYTKPVFISYKTKVSIIERNVPPFSPINYDAEQHTRKDKPSTTATLRIGYDNGFPIRAYSDKTEVIIRGQRFPVIGKSSMNMVVVDITDQDPKNPIQMEDEVVIIGTQGKQSITIEDFAARNKLSVTAQLLQLGNQNPRVVVDKLN